MASKGIKIHKPKTREEFDRLNSSLTQRGFVALDVLKRGKSGMVSLGDKDPSGKEADAMATTMGCGAWSNGPLSKVAWQFDCRDDDSVTKVYDKDGKTELGLGYVSWGPKNNIPSTIPPLAQSSPYTAAPLRYIADTICGLGPALMYRFPDGTLCDMKDAGYKILEQLEKKREAAQNKSRNNDITEYRDNDGAANRNNDTAGRQFLGSYVMTDAGIMTIEEAEKLELEPRGVSMMPRNLGPDYWNRLYAEWEKSWYGYEAPDALGISSHVPGAKDFIEENNLNLHLSQCMQDNVMLDIYFPTVGFSDRGLRKSWDPKITKLSLLPAHSIRLEKMDDNRYIHHCYMSDGFRLLGTGSPHVVSPESMKIKMYPAAMPQHLLSELRYIVSSNQKSRINARPMWVVCPTLYPSLNKPYYPQPAWWSVFTSEAFDFSATILYDKYKQRENNTSWGKILYLSIDYIDRVFNDQGYAGNPEKQQEFIDQLDQQMEDFLQHRENHGKYMRQWMWEGPDGKEHHNIEIVDIKDAVNDEVKAGKEELELSTSPIFLALQVDPRLVGVPMVQASNGGTALREMALLKQQQLNVHQRNYCYLLDNILRFNQQDCGGRAEWHVKQYVLSTLDRSKTGLVESVSEE